MICKTCRTEIADRALICYRCGAATVAPPRPSASTPGRGWVRRVPAIAALALLIVAALFMLSMGRAASGDALRVLVWVVLGLALIVLIWRVARWRR